MRIKLILIMYLVLAGCLFLQGAKPLRTGMWKGQLQLAGEKKAPFLFSLQHGSNGKYTVVLMNGAERVELPNVTLNADSVIIPIEAFDAQIKARLTEYGMDGVFLKNFIPKDKGIHFEAEYGNSSRFVSTSSSRPHSIDGNWDVWFYEGKNDSTHNVGVFKSENSIVTGSVLTSSGDLRYLEGIQSASSIQLSAFGGLSPYLFDFTMTDESHFIGSFYTARSITMCKGTRNMHAGLADPYSLAKMKPGFSSISFSLLNEKGQKISLTDERYRNKVIVLSVLGSWCPNCLDEMKFLAPWYKENHQRGVEVIGLAFERKDDYSYAQGTISRLKSKNAVDYEILFAGKAGAEYVSRVLPGIEGFGGYPTTIFIDKKGQVRKIYTGYNGPATGLFYEEFEKDFNRLIDGLLAE